MKKYWVTFKNGFQASLVYRIDLFLMLFFEAFTLLFLIYLWFSVYNQGSYVGDYTLKNLIFYYIFMNFISSSINAWNVARQMEDFISSGEVSVYLVKPLSFMLDMFFDNLGGMIQRLLIHFSLALGIFFIFKPFLYSNLFHFIISLFIAIIINFLIFYILGLSTFYFGVNFGISFFVFGIIQFFSGALIPLDVLPEAFLNISDYLPFKFLVFIPVSVLSGKLEWGSLYLLEGGMWIVILFILAKILYSNGLKRYESYGG